VTVAAVEDHVGVVARSVCRLELKESRDLGLQRLLGHAAAGVVAAEGLDEVVGEEALDLVQHARGALVQLLDLARRQQHGLAVQTTGQTGGKQTGFSTGDEAKTTPREHEWATFTNTCTRMFSL